jgi:hypothetical protein
LFSEREDAPQSEEPLDGDGTYNKKYENLAPSVMCIFKLKPFPAWRMTTKVITRVTHARKISIGQLESNVLARRAESIPKSTLPLFFLQLFLDRFLPSMVDRLL